MRSDNYWNQLSSAVWIMVLWVSCPLFAVCATGSALGYPDYLSSKKYSIYKGDWSHWPDVKNLTAVRTISEGELDPASLNWDSSYAVKYTATLEIPVQGKYLFLQNGADSCVVLINGEQLVINDGVQPTGIIGPSRTVEKLVHLKAGRYAIRVNALFRRHHLRIYEFRVEGPDLYQVARTQWVYFGWENDYPKSWGFMGGTVVPGRRQRVQFAIESDGKLHYPDEMASDRRESIKWYLADEFMPSPVSEWMAGAVAVRIQHFAQRLLNDKATAVFTRVRLTNATPDLQAVTLDVNAGPEQTVPLTQAPTRSNTFFMFFDITLPAGKTVSVDFVSRANGDISSRELKSIGGFDKNYEDMAAYLDRRAEILTHPTALPDQSLLALYRAAQIILWQTVVKVDSGDVEMRGSGGNPAGFYQYDRTFSHDVPDMVTQFIREGDVDLAKRIMESGYYQRNGRKLEQDYLDAIPKYVIPYATYLQVTGDKAYFTPDRFKSIKEVARSLHGHRDFTVQGPKRGIMNRSHTLDNPPYYLLVSNFAAFHGLAAYQYLCNRLGEAEEARWAESEMEDLNTCVNTALKASMDRRKVNWYMATFDDTTYFWKNGYDGNWLTGSLMMAHFPWGGSLRGYSLGGVWKETFDKSISYALQQRDTSHYNIPPKSWGAWWGAEYGSCYNAGMGLQCLYSDKHRTQVIGNLEWLIENQSAPFQWGENMYRPRSEHDWTRPAVDYEVWGHSFDKQALLDACVAVKTDGTVIIGRGVPDAWLEDGKVIAWKNVFINDGKKLDFSISTKARVVTLKLEGDKPAGKVLFDLPLFGEKVAKIVADGKPVKLPSPPAGPIELEPGTRERGSNTGEVSVL